MDDSERIQSEAVLEDPNAALSDNDNNSGDDITPTVLVDQMSDRIKNLRERKSELEQKTGSIIQKQITQQRNDYELKNEIIDVENLSSTSKTNSEDGGSAGCLSRYSKRTIIGAIVANIVFAVGLSVGFSLKSNSKRSESELIKPAGEQVVDDNEDPLCNYRVLRKCFCAENDYIIPTSYETKYNTLKADLIESKILQENFDDDSNFCEPRKLVLYWLAEDSIENGRNPEQRSLVTRFILGNLFLSTTNERYFQWENRAGWLTSDKECDWFGISCNQGGDEVTSIALNKNNLTGTIPPEISQLTQLEFLNFGFNSISGSIPSEIGVLIKLSNLRLSGNLLTGAIPSELGLLSDLEFLYLHRNVLSDQMPNEMMALTNLEELNLANNGDLEGTIPKEIGNLVKLKRLHINNCKISGTLPVEIGLCNSLKRVIAGSNNITGGIPTNIGLLENLNTLQLFSNQITGSIPTTIGLCKQLRFLDLSLNSYLTGTIPSELGKVNNLVRFDSCFTNLTGDMPQQICDLRTKNINELVSQVECNCCTTTCENSTINTNP